MGDGLSWRCGGEREGGILKSFSIKRQWIPVFRESGLIVSWAGLTLARGDPQAGGNCCRKNPWCPGGLGRSAGMWAVKKSGLFYPKIKIMGKINIEMKSLDTAD